MGNKGVREGRIDLAPRARVNLNVLRLKARFNI